MQLARYAPVFFTVVAGVAVANYTFKPLLEDAARHKQDEETKRQRKPEAEKKEGK